MCFFVRCCRSGVGLFGVDLKYYKYGTSNLSSFTWRERSTGYCMGDDGAGDEGNDGGNDVGIDVGTIVPECS